MRDAAMKEFIKLSETSGPLGEIVKGATEDGIVVASKLEEGLKAAGMTVEYKAGNAGHYVTVTKPGTAAEGEEGQPAPIQVAFGYSGSKTDALKQAMFGAVKEETTSKAAA